MDIWQFYQTMGAVIAGNLMSAVIIWFFIQAARNEAEGKKSWDQPWYMGLWVIIASGIFLGSIFSVAG